MPDISGVSWLASQTIYTVGGTIQPGVGIYIKRKADDELLKLCRAGELAFILSSRQVGKSSLMAQTARKLEEINIRSSLVDLSSIGTKIKQDEWYLGILNIIATDLNLKTNIFAWWARYAGLGPSQRFFNFLREVLLTEVKENIVLFFDEIDTTLSIDFADDFFATVRAIYNARATTTEFNRLSFVLIGVATPSDLISDSKRTPFNIGQRVDLNDFTLEDAMPLAQGLGDHAGKILAWILEWTRGHPYMTQRLCEQISKADEQVDEQVVARLVEQLYLGDQREQDNNLQFVRDLLVKRSPDARRVMITYGDIRAGKKVTDDEHSIVKAHLKLSGIVRSQDGRLVLRNQIYESVFDPKWVKDNTPSSIPRRIMIGSMFAIVLTLISAVYLAYQERTRTDAERAARYTSNFQSSDDAPGRLANLASLFQLEGYSDDARVLFNQLTQKEKLQLFAPADSQEMGQHQVIIVNGLYQFMANTEDENLLLQAMKEAVKNADPSSHLYDEITAWLNGRKELNEKNFYSAEASLKLAIENNPKNPSVYYDLALTHIGLKSYPRALDDLTQMIQLDLTRISAAKFLIEKDEEFSLYWRENSSKYPALAQAIPPLVEVVDNRNVKMVLISEGKFIMGSDPTLDLASQENEQPAHEIYLDSFYIDKFEVTNLQYKACVEARACQPPYELSSAIRARYFEDLQFGNYPVLHVDWNMAKTYCDWRSARLPTEAEWEKAARNNDSRVYPWGNSNPSSDMLNYGGSVGDTTAVGSYQKGVSFYGVYDMAGNVWEWVSDWYGEKYYQDSPSENPTGPAEGQARVLRGGSWNYNKYYARSALRQWSNPGSAGYDIGFRCARSN